MQHLLLTLRKADLRRGLLHLDGSFRKESFLLTLTQKLGRNIDAALKHEGDGIAQHICIERLGYESGGTELQHAHDVGLIDDAREHQNFECRVGLNQLFEKTRRRLHARQIQVKNQQIRIFAVFAHKSSRIFGRAAGQDLSSFKLCLEQNRKSLNNQRMVVDEKKVHMKRTFIGCYRMFNSKSFVAEIEVI